MNWREAFLRQAASDIQVMDRLNVSDVPNAHRLHYLQMAAEKLAKALLTSPHNGAPPPRNHKALVRMLQTLKQRPDFRRRFQISNNAFKHYINAILPIAALVEKLAPAGLTESDPNPEYPWRNLSTNMIIAPADFDFPEINGPQLNRLVLLIRDLARQPI